MDNNYIADPIARMEDLVTRLGTYMVDHPEGDKIWMKRKTAEDIVFGLMAVSFALDKREAE